MHQDDVLEQVIAIVSSIKGKSAISIARQLGRGRNFTG